MNGQVDVKLKRLVLLGGGHSHLTVLKSFGMKPLPGLQVTLVTKDVMTPYSGMIPGYVAGHYTRDECHIDLCALAAFAGVRLVHAACSHIDAAARELHFPDRPPIGYDCLSIDIGIAPKAGVPGFEHVTPVKPIDGFVARIDSLMERAQQERGTHAAGMCVVVVGGGAGGVEVAFAVQHRLRKLLDGAATNGSPAPACTVKLLTRGKVLPSHPAKARTICLHEAEASGLDICEGTSVSAIEESALVTEGGERVAFDECLWCTQAAPAAWLQGTSLPKTDGGFLAISDTLQSAGGPPEVFACGDVATSVVHPRPKAGVFAVRQGQPLVENLRRFLTGKPPEPFKPQTAFLGLITFGKKRAVATRGGLAFAAEWLWPVKDSIDRAFMRKFGAELPAMQADVGPAPDVLQSTEGADAAAHAAWHAAAMQCRGCAAKVGPATLRDVLATLPQASLAQPPATEMPNINGNRTNNGHHAGSSGTAAVGGRDDAALLPPVPAGHIAVQTVDFLNACVADPYLFGRIAAVHAMSDCFAMGAAPTSALAIAQVPHGAPDVVREDLSQMMHGAATELQAAGCRIAGGHSCLGAELALGFTVTGHAPEGGLMLKGGLRAGQALVLTKAVGTGLVMRAGMLRAASARALTAAWRSMAQSNGGAAAVLRGAGVAACTDVTGFGLLGHALEMAEASEVSLSIDARTVPLLPGVKDALAAGIKSTAYAANAQLAHSVSCSDGDATDRLLPALWDPQTSGGLLFGVDAGSAAGVIQQLQAVGCADAVVIGVVASRSVKGAPLVRLERGKQSLLGAPDA